MSKNFDEARKVAESLLDDLENTASSVGAILMKAKRLARLMRDSDAQTWLTLETRGYPDKFSFSELGTCKQYAVSGGRIDLKESTYLMKSLPAIEASYESEEAHLISLKTTKQFTGKVDDFLQSRATESLMKTQTNTQLKQKISYASAKSQYLAMISSIHEYVTETYIALELGDIAQDIFEDTRGVVDKFIRSHCPKSAEKLVAINERMTDGSEESRSSALTSCRRLLMDVADSVFPASKEDWTDRKGKKRKVGVDQYKNRLLAYLVDLVGNNGNYELLDSQIEHLASRLDIIYEKTCKGVHIDVSMSEAKLAVIHTYLFVGEIAIYTEKGAESG